MGVIYSRWQQDKSSKLKSTPKPQHKFHLTAGSQHSNGGGSRAAAVLLGLLLKDTEDRKKNTCKVWGYTQLGVITATILLG